MELVSQQWTFALLVCGQWRTQGVLRVLEHPHQPDFLMML